MATRRVETGTTGETVRENITRVRKQMRLTLRDVAERLESTDRPLAHNTISEIERGARRVDVDDLMAIAYVLEVNPNTLLLPHVADRSALTDVVEATGLPQGVQADQIWAWADGLEPLFRPYEPVDEYRERVRPPWQLGMGADAFTPEDLRQQMFLMAENSLAVTASLQDAVRALQNADVQRAVEALQKASGDDDGDS